MTELGPEYLVFNTTNIVGGGVREIVTAPIAEKYDGMGPAHVGRTTAQAMRAALADARSGNGNNQ